MGERKRVLFVGDSPAQSTGYATIFRELLPRLQAWHDVALLGCFGEGGDDFCAALPFKVYRAWPQAGDAEGRARHDSEPLMKWGRWYFEKTCLEYQPDAVALIRDVDHDEWVYRSPYRRHFRVLAMPTVDARPQKDEWVGACAQADALLSYTEFGGLVLSEQVGGLAPYLGVGTPGVNASAFTPAYDKEAHKAAAGLGGKFVVGCFAADTPVLMSDHSAKPIQDVRAGDEVVTHLGRNRRVVAAHSFPVDKPMVRVTAAGDPPVVCTADHEWLAVRPPRYESSGLLKVKLKDVDWTPRWSEAKDLRPGDFLAFRIPSETRDVAEYVTPTHRFVVDDDFLFLAGYYLANGSIASHSGCHSHSVEFTIPGFKPKVVDAVIRAARAVFGKASEARTRKTSRAVTVACSGVSFARPWLDMFGHGAAEKMPPDWFAALPPAKQMAVVRGWQAGDGCDAQDGRNIGSSVNLPLITWMRVALLRNGIPASITKTDMTKGSRFPNAKQQWKMAQTTAKAKSNVHHVRGEYYFTRVSKVEAAAAGDRVYDLTVAEDHSYAVFAKSVHNTIMRNQDRKLFPELIAAFARFVELAPPDVAQRAALYLHTGHPDMVGWDLPKLLLEAGVAARTYFTYLCRACGAHYPAHWAGAVVPCRACGRVAAQTANSDRGVSTPALAGVYNLFDVYCHLAYAGGLELPLLEAAACGVSVVTNDYAAMGELGRALGADLVPGVLHRQFGTGRLVHAPDVEAVARTLLAQSALPTAVRRHRGYQQGEVARREYTWERSTERWAAALASLPPPERPWDAPRADWAGTPPPPADSLSDAAFARHCLWVLRANTSPGGLDELKLSRDLAHGDRSAVWARVAAEAGVLTEWETERLRRFACSSSATTRKPVNAGKSPAAT
jgi:glycosyltransferase involved in cell wall biosynthesis